jgi:hypothetical protein
MTAMLDLVDLNKNLRHFCFKNGLLDGYVVARGVSRTGIEDASALERELLSNALIARRTAIPLLRVLTCFHKGY